MLLIYSGQEAALNRRLEFFEKDEIIWDSIPLEDFYRSLIELKTKNQALWNGEYGGEYTRLSSSNMENVFPFGRKKNNNSIIVICNLSADTVQTQINFNTYKGDYINWFSKDKRSISKQDNFNLSPWEYLVFVK